MSLRKSALILFSASLTIRLAFVALSPRSYGHEFADYEAAAVNLLEGKGMLFPREPGSSVNFPEQYRAFRPPVFTLLVAGCYALTGVHRLGVYIVHALMDGATTLLVLGIASHFWGPSAGLIAAGLYGVYMESIFSVNIMTPFTIGAFLLALSVWLHLCWTPRSFFWKAAAGGLLAGLLALTRSEFILLLPVSLWWQWRYSEKPRTATILAFGFFALACLPWTLRNYLALGQWVWGSTNGPLNYYIVVQNFANRWSRQPHPIALYLLPPGTTETGMAPILYPKLIRFYGALGAWDWLSLASWGILLVLFPFFPDGSYNLTFGWMLPFMAAGIGFTSRPDTRHALWLPILALSSIYAAMLIGNPYRVVLSPLFVLMAAPALQRWFHPPKSHGKKRAAALLAWTALNLILYLNLEGIKPWLKNSLYFCFGLYGPA
ncbi:MAG: glycosyltransferase family 39 protein [Elusimicrobia bacterium]|nr:glycosyltransferase family 39 protein [Elusimicrobiota bacterium]